MKRSLFIILLLSPVVLAQSPTSLKNFNPRQTVSFNSPNAWFGFKLSYPLAGDAKDFDSSFGIDGSVVLDFAEFVAGRSWKVIAYTNMGLPNYNQVDAFDNVAATDQGISVGMQGYTSFGDPNKKALTVYLNAATKLNTFGNMPVTSYRFGPGFEFSLRGSGLPLVANISPSYVIVNKQSRFSGLQNETDRKGFWTANAFVIFPFGEKLGLLVQSAFTESANPAVKVGVIVATGM